MDSQIQTLSARESSESTIASTRTSDIKNGDFETGDFRNWNTIGDTKTKDLGTTKPIEIEDLEIFPPKDNQALITNAYSDAGGSVIDSDLEEFLDLTPGSLDHLVRGDAVEGSSIKQTFTVKAGDIISFDWTFITNEDTPDPTYNDTAFLTLNGFTFKLADTEAKFIEANHVDEFEQQTGTQNLRFEIENAGTYTIGFGVVDVGDYNDDYDSGLVIDNVAVEQPHSGILSNGNNTSPGLSFGEDGFTLTDSSSAIDTDLSLVFGDGGFEVV